MNRLWFMIAGVLPLWAAMSYMDLSLYSTAMVYLLYFGAFVLMLNRVKKGRGA